jgi:hypothetical protein
MTPTPLRIGQRVRSTPSGDPGRVARRQLEAVPGGTDTSYLVLWESGGESWCERSAIEPLRIGDPIRREAGSPRSVSLAGAGCSSLIRFPRTPTPAHSSRVLPGGRAACDDGRVPAYADVVRLAERLPEVEQSTSYGTPALKVRGRKFCRLWGEREHARNGVDDSEVLVVFCELEWKQTLLDGSDGVLFTTPHYDGHGSVLVRLADVDPDELFGLLEASYLLKA